MEHAKTTKNIGQPCVICGQPANLQRALDAEREKVKEYMTNYVPLKALEDVEAQPATLQAQAKQLDRTLADVYQQRDGLQAQLRQVEGERDHAKKMEAVQKEVADNQTWHVQKLKDWRDTVTLALQRPGGARFEDVPEHIKGLVRELTTLQQLVAALPVVDVQEVSVWLSPDESGWLVSKRPAFQAGLYWAKFRTQAEADSFRALLAYRATLVVQDAPQPAPNERVEYARLELAALFSTPGAPTLEQAKLVCENKNPADAQCILNAYEALREAAQDAGKVSTSIIGKQVPPSQWNKNAGVSGDVI